MVKLELLYRNLEFSQCSLLWNRTGSGKIFDEEDVEEWFPQQKRPFLSRRCWGPISFRTSDQNLINFIGRQAYVVCLVPQNTDTTVPTGTVVLYTYFIPSVASTATVATAKNRLLLPLKLKGFFGKRLVSDVVSDGNSEVVLLRSIEQVS